MPFLYGTNDLVDASYDVSYYVSDTDDADLGHYHSK
jgi:hypothetical protein